MSELSISNLPFGLVVHHCELRIDTPLLSKSLHKHINKQVDFSRSKPSNSESIKYGYDLAPQVCNVKKINITKNPEYNGPANQTIPISGRVIFRRFKTFGRGIFVDSQAVAQDHQFSS